MSLENDGDILSHNIDYWRLNNKNISMTIIEDLVVDTKD
jgi:hypothetical protein